MAPHPLLDLAAREEAPRAVADVEARTGAEVVIAARKESSPYLHANLSCGAVAAFGSLLALIYLPQEFWIHSFPFITAASFAAGAVLCARIRPLRRFFISRRQRDAAVRSAAREAFVDFGMANTTGHTGVLIYASVLERRVEVVTDVGIPAAVMGEPWRRAVADLEAKMHDRAAFFASVRALGPLLEKSVPRSPNDINELPDGMEVA